ncbi:diphthine--ammonia ligase [Virgibacillus sp. NKC19-16]|uniref:Dph6-related ATP pyrophosphatase n=1 Tax=Virgibacillus salidurans TaxID=2831673 RepID=UPI001F28CD19|nr:diphthine--ammonia ligase [Virgibacillus sp. NKC19-16]UJL47339.1 diphthine--ammonia ligase [Virgibacillus sp. NKC19-16]
MAEKIALSFSGGKDSCLALYRLQEQNMEVSCLVTTVWKEKQKTVAHDEKLDRIKAQAESFNIPEHFIETDFDTYTHDFVETLKELKRLYNIDAVAFGDIYLEGHREWGEQVAEAAGLKALYPLWSKKEDAPDLLREFVSLDFKAVVIRVDDAKLPKEWVGRKLDEAFIQDIREQDVCPMGESGEYHTTVFDGPIFRYPLRN